MDLTSLIMKISNPSSTLKKTITKSNKLNKSYIRLEIKILLF